MTAETELDHQLANFEVSLRKLAPVLPGTIRYRMENTLDHFDRAFRMLEADREMASFRAITGEEEAATTLMHAIQLRRYQNAKKFNPRNHEHKAAVLACVLAIGRSVAPILEEFQLIVNIGRKRIDLKIPLSNFGVKGGETYSLQPVEPLDFVHTKAGIEEENLFDAELKELAKGSNFESIKRMVAAQANARNTLLYASDSSPPISKALVKDIVKRKNNGLALLTLAVMVLQSRKHLALVKHAILAFLSVIARLPIVTDAEGQ